MSGERGGALGPVTLAIKADELGMGSYTRAIVHILAPFSHRWHRTLPLRSNMELGPHPSPPPHAGPSGHAARVGAGWPHTFVTKEASDEPMASASDL